MPTRETLIIAGRRGGKLMANAAAAATGTPDTTVFHLQRSLPMPLPRFVSGKNLTAVDGGFILNLNNPIDADYAGLPYPKGTVLPSNDLTGKTPPNPCAPGLQTMSVVPDSGDMQGRPLGTKGTWEVAQKKNGFLVWGAGGSFALPFVE